MKFLCGRPGCGKESTATLQIDAVSSTVSIVDPRTSRDGVPLCARHADATTPPLGWSMNDLRTTSRVLSPVPDGDAVITSTPPRVRPEQGGDLGSERAGSRKMSRRQSIAERARQEAMAQVGSDESDDGSGEAVARADGAADSAASTLFDDEALNAKLARRASRRARADQGPESRPSRRRKVDEEEPVEQDRFPWSFQLDDDEEPEELRASTPLLSRAFRATTG